MGFFLPVAQQKGQINWPFQGYNGECGYLARISARLNQV